LAARRGGAVARRAAVVALLGAAGGAACARPAATIGRAPLQGRLGGAVSAIARRVGASDASETALPPTSTGLFRRVYETARARISVEALTDGRVRQITIGRERAVAETWEPDPADWTLAAARALAAEWLPADAVLLRSEPFAFRGTPAGTRDVYRSPSLAGVLASTDYAAASALGPPGMCAATYYQTTSGGVAFILVGLV
jgi:hypothetical protein